MTDDQTKENLKPVLFSYEFESLVNSNNIKEKQKYVEKLEEAINYLLSLKSSDEIMQSHSSYEAIFYIDKVISYKSDLIDYNIFSKLNFDKIFGDLLLYLYESNSNFDFKKNKIAIKQPKIKCDQNERNISILFYILDIISIIMNESLEFRIKFQYTNGLIALINFISDQNFIKKNLKTNISGFLSNKFNIIDFIASNINLISKNSQISYEIWLNKLNAIHVLNELARTKSSSIDLVYSTIINISNDSNLNNISSNIINDLIEKLKIMSLEFKSENFNRNSLVVEEDISNRKNEIEIHFVIHNDINPSSAFYIFDSLVKIARNLDLAYKLYYDFAIKELLKQIIVYSNQFERVLILKLMLQLSFNEKIAQDMKKDVDLVTNKLNLILKQCDLVTNENVQIKFYIEILKFILNDESESNFDKIVNDKQIYFSYSESSYIKKKEEIINEINKLTQLKFLSKVNYSNIIKNIRISSCVILLIDQSYRCDLRCQIEANIALKLKKLIIPILILEEDEMLIKESWIEPLIQNFKTIKLKNMQDLNNDVLSETSINNKDNQKASIELMNHEEIVSWLKINKLNFDHKLIESLEKIKCDGKTMKQLWQMKKDIPEFFEQSFVKTNDLNNDAIEVLFNELDLLFKKDNDDAQNE